MRNEFNSHAVLGVGVGRQVEFAHQNLKQHVQHTLRVTHKLSNASETQWEPWTVFAF